MKTIDEVIDKFEKADLTWSNIKNNLNYEDFRDALFYLKEYRDECNNIVNVHDDYIRLRNEMAEELNKANPALTWDELKQMKGKPVWVEDNLDTPEDITKYWAIMWRIEKAEGDEYALLSDFYYQKSQYRENWQAYRKERK